LNGSLGGYVEVVGGLVADHDVDLHATCQRAVDLTNHPQRQVEVRRADGQVLLRAGNQLKNRPVQRVVLAYAQQRRDRQAVAGSAALAGVVRRVLEAAAQIADVVAQAAGGRQVRQIEAMHSL
jgi:hypothetical protein